MKKFLSIVLVTILCLSIFTACNKPKVETEEVAPTETLPDQTIAQIPENPTTPSEENTKPTEPTKELSNNPLSLEIFISGEIIQPPCHISTILNAGFEISEEYKGKTIQDNDTITVEKDGDIITLTLFAEEADTAYEECFIDDITIDQNSVKNNEIYIWGKISIGTAERDLINMYRNFDCTQQEADEYLVHSFRGNGMREFLNFYVKDGKIEKMVISSGGIIAIEDN